MLTADSSAISSIKLPNYVKVSACASKVRNNSYRPAYRLAVVNVCRVKCLPSILSDRFVLLLYNFNVKSLKRRFGEEKIDFHPRSVFPTATCQPDCGNSRENHFPPLSSVTAKDPP